MQPRGKVSSLPGANTLFERQQINGQQGPAAYTKDRLVLSPERVPHKHKTVTVKQQ
jgi:hypothetical protein